MKPKGDEIRLVEDENIFIHDATPTWSGFIYQGEVAIYLALHKICELIDNGLPKEVIKLEYWLEIEKSEDIAIVKDDGKQRQYLSIHQVKNQKDNSIHDYRNPLIQLMLEKGFWEKNKLGNPEAFLHVSNRIKEDNNTINQKILDLEKHIKEFYNNIRDFIDKNIEDAERENFYQEISEKMDSEPIKLNRAQYTKLIAEVKKSCDDKKFDLVKNKLKELDEYLENKLAVEYIDKKIALYQYDDKKFYCEGIELFEKIIEQVRRYKSSDRNISNGQYEYIADRLVHYMRSYILQRHHKMQRNEDIKTRTISFNNLIDILDSSISKYEREANILTLRRRYGEILSQYCRAVCKYQCKKTNNYGCKIYKNEYEKINLADEEFVRMCFHYNPDCDKSIDARDCLMKLLIEQGMWKSAFEILKNSNVDFINENDKTRIIVNNQNNNAFLTAIVETDSEIAVEKITKGINNNAELVSPIFEADELITVQLSSEESVWDYDYAEIEESFIGSQTKQDSDVNQNSIFKPKKPRFITAREIIEQFS